ncbi:MAG: hypothetical protein AAF840_07300, partial [Bacteroidota bacterium]
PTPDEYVQIRTILSRIPHTHFNVYQPCDGAEGVYNMQLSHWLNAEARLINPLQEGELLAHQQVFSLQPNGFGGSMRAEPHDAAGYFTPSLNQTLIKIDNAKFGRPDDPNPSIITAEGGFSADILPEGYAPANHFRPSIVGEELVVFVNGERVKLMPPVTSDISVLVNGRDLLDPVNPATNIRIIEKGEQKTIGIGYPTFTEMPHQPRVPANARLMCLLGTIDLNWKVQRHLSYNASGPQAAWLDNLRLPQERKIQYWYNDRQVSRDFVHNTDFGTHNLIQVGYLIDDPTGDIIVQVVDDMVW